MYYSSQWCSGKFGAGGTLDDGGTEGPERGAEARSAGAPKGWGLERGAVAPPQYGGLGAMPPEKISKINLEISYFSSFLQTEMVPSVLFSHAVSVRHD